MTHREGIVARACFGLAGVALAFVAMDAFAQTDHFKCYVTNELTLEQPTPVGLEDQFGEQSGVLVHNAGWFCNPTAKDDGEVETPILEPSNHLTFYPISRKDPMPRLLVDVRNQFGDQELVLAAPRLLAVPTQKDDLPPPDNISHFKCYEARSPSLHIPVTLRDQFGEDDFRVLSATFFCNPASKTIDEITTPAEPDEEHLTCYKLTPSRNPMEPDFVDISNQFDTEDTLRIGPSQYLCVPSEKLNVRSGGRNPADDELSQGLVVVPEVPVAPPPEREDLQP